MNNATATGTATGTGWRTAQAEVRALCCVCGTLRTMSLNGGRRTGDAYAVESSDVRERCLASRKCATCKAVTSHAYLRDGDEYRDHAEAADRARQTLNSEVERLLTCGVTVVFDEDGGMVQGGAAATVVQLLNDGAYVVYLSPLCESAVLLRVLDRVWSLLVTPLPETAWTVTPGQPDAGLPPVRTADLMGPED